MNYLKKYPNIVWIKRHIKWLFTQINNIKFAIKLWKCSLRDGIFRKMQCPQAKIELPLLNVHIIPKIDWNMRKLF